MSIEKVNEYDLKFGNRKNVKYGEKIPAWSSVIGLLPKICKTIVQLPVITEPLFCLRLCLCYIQCPYLWSEDSGARSRGITASSTHCGLHSKFQIYQSLSQKQQTPYKPKWNLYRVDTTKTYAVVRGGLKISLWILDLSMQNKAKEKKKQ